MAKGFCKSCDLCAGCFYRIQANFQYWLGVVFTLGIYILIYRFGLANCPTCGHKMMYHRGNTNYWLKKQKNR